MGDVPFAIVHSRDSPAELPRKPGPDVRARTALVSQRTLVGAEVTALNNSATRRVFGKGNITNNLRLFEHDTAGTAYCLRVGKIDRQRTTVRAAHRLCTVAACLSEAPSELLKIFVT